MEAGIYILVFVIMSVTFLMKGSGRWPIKEPRFHHTSAMYITLAALFVLAAVQKAVKAGWLPGGPALSEQLAWILLVNVAAVLPVFGILEWRAHSAMKKAKRDS